MAQVEVLHGRQHQSLETRERRGAYNKRLAMPWIRKDRGFVISL